MGKGEMNLAIVVIIVVVPLALMALVNSGFELDLTLEEDSPVIVLAKVIATIIGLSILGVWINSLLPDDTDTDAK